MATNMVLRVCIPDCVGANKGILTIFYVRRVLRYAKIVPDKKKKLAFSFFLFYFLRHGIEQSSHGLFFMSHA